MAGGVEGNRGGILELLQVVKDFEEFIAYDLLTIGRSLDELSESLSKLELRAFLRRHPGAYAAEVSRLKRIEATPPEQRQVGGRDDALPIAELDSFLGWD